MVADYPGLRRRAPRGVEVNVPPLPTPQTTDATRRSQRRWKASQLYCFVSLIVAILSVVTGGSTGSCNASSVISVSAETVKLQKHSVAIMEELTPRSTGTGTKIWNPFSWSKATAAPPPPPPSKKAPAWIRWILPTSQKQRQLEQQQREYEQQLAYQQQILLEQSRSRWFHIGIDPLLLERPTDASTWTALLDKVLTSTPRLLAMANLLLSITYLVHTAVANVFLDIPSLSRESWAGRERLGGFLVFKLLLVSAVVAPDTLDLLILLSWYTLLSFLRSLAGLCAATTAHTAQSGQPPRKGVMRLLLLILVSNFIAASVCVALFHQAGYDMVFLLTCDCVLLAVDAMSYILRHLQQAIDLQNSILIARLEANQVALHENHRRRMAEESNPQAEAAVPIQPLAQLEFPPMTDEKVLEESRAIDLQMERLEAKHNKRLEVLEGAVFMLQLAAYMLTIAHFLHIWSLHGLQFTLIDGVLALHLHSALSAASKKIAERRNLNRIARDLDAMFEDATEVELTKSPDVFCCICLGTMATGSVKKVGCGHMYHTHCLREVVERARSIEAAKCPLCRASVLSGEPPEGNDDDGPNNIPGTGGGEHALFRFSTEGILPAWLPLPAFAFEVVRRPTTGQDNNAVAAAGGNNIGGDNTADGGDGQARAGGQRAPPPSFLRRVMTLFGFVSMSATEEAAALSQLVDMFPQYDRADLLRELRSRGSGEGVVESVLMGTFTGTARGGENADDQEGPPIVAENTIQTH